MCGSDTHYYDHGRIGSYVVREPLVLGHEASGVIEEVGAGVNPARVGQRVSIEPGVPCRRCRQCLAGRYNLCPDVRFHATPPIDGSLAELIVVSSTFAHPVPDSVSDEAAALLEPLSVGIWACRKGGVGIDRRVLITGAGPIGLVALQVARAAGAEELIVCDLNDDRLAAATDLGATRTINTGDLDGEDALARKLTGSDPGTAPPDVLLECTGHAGLTRQALTTLAPAASAVLVGMGGTDVTIPLSVLQEREITITGTFRYANTWPTAIALAASGRVALERLVTSRHPLADTATALTASRSDPRNIKALVQPQL